MDEATSLYLDLVRVAAAMTVFLGHASAGRLTGGVFWRLTDHGPEAVDVFFVLSGFVIAHVTAGRERSAAAYGLSRAARICSVALPALLLTLILDDLGRRVDPALYAHWGAYHWHGRPEQFLRGLFFLNETWFTDLAPGSDFPYWSLGYEVWFYVVFGVAVFAPGGGKWAAALLLLALGPAIAALFPVWLMGVACHRFCTRGHLRRGLAWSFCLGPLLPLAAYEILVGAFGRPRLSTPYLRSTTIQDYLIGALFALHLAGFRFLSHRPAALLRRFSGPIRWVAGASFALYLFHAPLIQFLGAMAPWAPESWQRRALIFLGTPLIVLALAELTERRKALWRRGFARLLARVAPDAAGRGVDSPR